MNVRCELIAVIRIQADVSVYRGINKHGCSIVLCLKFEMSLQGCEFEHLVPSQWHCLGSIWNFSGLVPSWLA